MLETINILMSVNQGYVEQLKTVICSLDANCRDFINLFLVHSGLSQRSIYDIKKMVRDNCHGELHVIKLESDFLAGAKVLSHFSIEMYYRIFASEFIPREIDRILWLDADLVVLRDLHKLFNLNLEGASIAACGHRERTLEDHTMNNDGISRLKLKKGSTYFNSGVILYDLKKIRKNFDREKVIKLIYEHPEKLLNPDQDVLNVLYENDVKIIDWKQYNFQIHYDWSYPNEKILLRDFVTIIHYVGPFKPWTYTTKHFSYNYYWKYYLIHGTRWALIRNELLRIAYVIYMRVKKYKRMD